MTVQPPPLPQTTQPAAVIHEAPPLKAWRPGAAHDPSTQRVVVVDVDISIGQMFWLMVKASIAAIPAMILMAILGGIVGAIIVSGMHK